MTYLGTTDQSLVRSDNALATIKTKWTTPERWAKIKFKKGFYFLYLQVYNDLSDAAEDSDEVKDVPSVSEIILKKQTKTNQ